MFTHLEAMLPILQYLSDGVERRRAEIGNAVADHFKLTEEQRAELLPSGNDLSP